MAKDDYYKTLGLEKGASKEEIKKAFHKMAHKYHPDKNGGDDAKFKEVNEAYQTLSDDSKRAQYDQYGNADFSNFGGGGGYGAGGFDFNGQGFEFNMGDLGDIFGDFFGGGMGRSQSRQRKGRDVATEINLSFKDAIFGVEKIIRIKKGSKCSTCSGTGGAPGEKPETCESCKGSGKITRIRRTMLGAIQEITECDNCTGTGTVVKKKCTTCRGSGAEEKQVELTINIPAGSGNGDTLRLSGGGEFIKNGIPGDLFLQLHVTPQHGVHREAHNLIYPLHITLTEAVLGVKRGIELIDGTVTLSIEPGTHHGEKLTVKSRGVPHPNGSRGNAIVIISIDIPKKLSKKAKELLDELKKEGL